MTDSCTTALYTDALHALLSDGEKEAVIYQSLNCKITLQIVLLSQFIVGRNVNHTTADQHCSYLDCNDGGIYYKT